MKHTLLASASIVVLAVVLLTWRGCAPRDASLNIQMQRQNDGRIVDGHFTFCGQDLHLGQMQPTISDERHFTSNGLQVRFERLPSTDDAHVVLSISSAEPFAKPCFDEDVQSPISVFLICDPAPAPIWTNFLERTWRTRSERPEYGLIALEGDQEGRLAGINFVAMPSGGELRHGPPFQATCPSDPGVLRPAETCNVAYRERRLGIRYVYLTRSMRPWRQVDNAVRATLEGTPSTRRCPGLKPTTI